MLARRRLITGIAGVPLAAILADSRLSALAAEGTESVSITTKGGQKVSGALALPGQTAGCSGAAHSRMVGPQRSDQIHGG
jgi:hypothetical protein